MYEVEWQNSVTGVRYAERFNTEENARLFFASLHIEKGYTGYLRHIILRGPDGKVLDEGHWEEDV